MIHFILALVFLSKLFISSRYSASKKGVFVGPHIQQLILHAMFHKTFKETELVAWKSFKQVCVNFLGLHKSDDSEDVVANLLHNYHKMECKMSLKVTFYIHIYHFFMKTREQFQKSTVRNFTRTLLLLKRVSKESNQLECSPNTAGHWTR